MGNLYLGDSLIGAANIKEKTYIKVASSRSQSVNETSFDLYCASDFVAKDFEIQYEINVISNTNDLTITGFSKSDTIIRNSAPWSDGIIHKCQPSDYADQAVYPMIDNTIALYLTPKRAYNGSTQQFSDVIGNIKYSGGSEYSTYLDAAKITYKFKFISQFTGLLYIGFPISDAVTNSDASFSKSAYKQYFVQSGELVDIEDETFLNITAQKSEITLYVFEPFIYFASTALLE